MTMDFAGCTSNKIKAKNRKIPSSGSSHTIFVQVLPEASRHLHARCATAAFALILIECRVGWWLGIITHFLPFYCFALRCRLGYCAFHLGDYEKALNSYDVSAQICIHQNITLLVVH